MYIVIVDESVKDEENMQIHFNAIEESGENRTMNVSGYITITNEKYEKNKKEMALKDLIRQHVSEKIIADENAE